MARFPRLSLTLAAGLLVAATGLSQQPTRHSDDVRRAPLGAKPERTVVHPENHGTELVVKFVHDSGIRLDAGAFAGPEASDETLTAIGALLEQADAAVRRLMRQPEAEVDAWRATAEARSGLDLHDLNLFFLVTLPSQEGLGALCDALNRFDLVEIAYPLGRLSDPVAPAPEALLELTSTWSARGGLPRVPAAGIGLVTGRRWSLPGGLAPSPDYEHLQGYRRAAPLGIDADYGQYFSGALGEQTTIVDVETGWTDDHEDIAHKALGNFVGLQPPPYPWDHGTAVLGELVGADDQSGVQGIVYRADVLMSSHLGSSSNIATAIMNAANAAAPGDVVVLEVQCYSSAPSPHPCEYDAAIFATVQTATANGTHVFAAAGNGGNNLDSSAYGGLFDRNVRDSGAVMCGASDGSSLNTAYFSNYGSRLDAHGWGFDVTTAGYGDLYNGGSWTREYTDAFSGTSSATPIVTGAGIMLNGIHREAFGAGLAPLDLRALLAATGTAQGSGGRIGPRPDVREAIATLNVPRLTVGGNLVPGGTVVVTLEGSPGDPFTLGFSTTLLGTPQYQPPYGYRSLGNLNRQANGTIGATGATVLSFPIPNDPGLSGQTVGWVQAGVRLLSQPGTGSFTNYQPVTIQ